MTSENDPFDWGSFATEYMGSVVSKIVKEEIKRAVADPDVKLRKVSGRWFIIGPKSKVREFENRVMSRIWNDGENNETM